MSRPRPLGAITELIIHCSATPNGRINTAADIDAWHKARGFRRNAELAKHSPLKHIGYHLVVRPNGAAEQGRRLDEMGAHAVRHNWQSIGICLIGTDRFSRAQWETLKTQVEIFRKKFPGIRVLGHRDTSPDTNGNGRVDPHEWTKTCPGFDVAAWLARGMVPADVHILED